MKIWFNIFVHGKWKLSRDEDFIIVANNGGILGAALIWLVSDLKVRFVFERSYFQSLRLKFLWRMLGLRCFGGDDEPEVMVKTMTALGNDIDSGKKICLLMGSGIIPNENTKKFFDVFDRIGTGNDLNIVPVYIGGSKAEKSYYFNVVIPKSRPAEKTVSIHFGKLMKFENKHWRIRREISLLMADYFSDLKKYRRPLIEYFVKAARKYKNKDCISDSTGKKLNYTQTLTASIIAADKMKSYLGEHCCVGILMPPCAGAAIANFAVNMLARTAVNLNYSTGRQTWETAAKDTGLDTIITSRKFLEKIQIEPDDERFVFIEDFIKDISPGDKIKGRFKSVFWPVKTLCRSRNLGGEDTAAILFTSGSSGRPKGIVLSFHNIISNIEQMEKIFRIYPTDRLCGVLPFFHSFGYTVSYWLALISGVPTYYVANPVDAAAVAKAVDRHKATILFATPTFIQSYIRRVEPAAFKSLRRVIVGAEKLKNSAANDFYDTFGVEVKQGYGTTELSPVVSVNPEDDLKIAEGNKPGTVGFVVPGTCVKIVDVENGNECEPGERGRIMLKGPSVMKGYLDDKKTADTFIDGWYDTGDIGFADEKRYLTISDRLSRFSKIGGEMVSHLKIEDLVHSRINEDRAVAVTGLPDEKKGEQLVVLCDKNKTEPAGVRKIINQSQLGNLYKPKSENYFAVDEIPLLGSGKLDIMAVKKIAENALKRLP